jgi:hypothetical protein
MEGLGLGVSQKGATGLKEEGTEVHSCIIGGKDLLEAMKASEMGVLVRGSGNTADDNVFLYVCKVLGWVSVILC